MPTHSETRLVPHTPRQMYDLVADVESYPEFLPWIAAARVRRSAPGEGGARIVDADLVVSFKLFRERFGSRVTLCEREMRIGTERIDGPFRHMTSNWRFERERGGCRVRFEVDYAFRNRILQSVAERFFHDAMRRVVGAFEARAGELHGSGAGE